MPAIWRCRKSAARARPRFVQSARADRRRACNSGSTGAGERCENLDAAIGERQRDDRQQPFHGRGCAQERHNRPYPHIFALLNDLDVIARRIDRERERRFAERFRLAFELAAVGSSLAAAIAALMSLTVKMRCRPPTATSSLMHHDDHRIGVLPGRVHRVAEALEHDLEQARQLERLVSFRPNTVSVELAGSCTSTAPTRVPNSAPSAGRWRPSRPTPRRPEQRSFTHRSIPLNVWRQDHSHGPPRRHPAPAPDRLRPPPVPDYDRCRLR